MAYFEGPRDVNIYGGTFNGRFDTGLTGLQILFQNITHGATHDSAERHPPPKCHPNTRKAIVNKIGQWTHRPLGTKESRIFWMNGPAGVGKTAIAQTVCQRLLESGQLGGSFFFSRLVAGRNDPRSLFSTIAYQLATAIPDTFGRAIEEKIKADPSILKKNMKLQLEKLIIEPLRLLDSATPPFVIVIDGLDECLGETTQGEIVRLLGSIPQHGNLPIKVVLTSRPEPWIRHEFDTQLLLPHTRRIAPDHQQTMANIPKPWPSPSIVDEFVERASGQFIYASTVLKFVGDPSNRPTVQLDLILSAARASKNDNSTNPFADLDQLYIQILSASPDKQQTLDFLGAVIALTEAVNEFNSEMHYSTTNLCRVMEELLGLQPEKALRKIRSLVDVSKDGEVKFFHKSFPDFLLDASRSGDYFIDINAIHSCMTLACLKRIRLNTAIAVRALHYSHDETVKGYAVYCWDCHWMLSPVSDQDQFCDEIKSINASLFYYHLAWEWVREMALTVRRRLHMRWTEPLGVSHYLLPCRKGSCIDSIEECHRRKRPSEAIIYFVAAVEVVKDLLKVRYKKQRALSDLEGHGSEELQSN
ncbi:hypothetical protein BDZ97DRAFT_2063390 [Flammula alnicola]|nr:hypothetical protein BDZ97DRAFT_2063390 [Flammula alnicola]